MKSIKYLGLGLIAATVLGGVAPAFAAETVATNKDGLDPKTKTQVEIVDPSKPHDNTTDDDKLVLNEVPTAFNFKTTLQNGKYVISATNPAAVTTEDPERITGKYEVFSNNEKVNWEVRSSLTSRDVEPVSNVLKTEDGSKAVDVTNYKIDESTIANDDPAADKGVVLKNTTASSDQVKKIGDLGLTQYTPKEIHIEFKAQDAEKPVAKGDKYVGYVVNTLYNTGKTE